MKEIRCMANIAQSEPLYEPNKAWEYGMLFNNAGSEHPSKLEAATGIPSGYVKIAIENGHLCIVKCPLNIIPAYPSNPQTTEANGSIPVCLHAMIRSGPPYWR